MNKKPLPFTKAQIKKIIATYPTPFHVYDEKAIRTNAKYLLKNFSWNKGFREFYAVKACPNPSILKILKQEGFGADCSSLPELILAEKIGLRGEQIMFTSNDTPAGEFKKAKELGAIINLDDITHIEFLEKHAGLPELISFRYNPGPLRKGNVIIGNPQEAKYGLTKDQLFQAYKICKDKGVKRFGIHTMVASNELNYTYFIKTANMLIDLVNEISKKVGIVFEFINIGGGIGIPYRPEQKKVDLVKVFRGIKKLFQAKLPKDSQLKLYMENGRVITGPYGYLVTTAIHKKDIYKKYIGLDASMANLMRPAIYGRNCYHHITVMGKEDAKKTQTYDVVGSLCENNDKFAIDRKLPKIEAGDIVVIHDTGAHGHAMGFNYNGKLRSAELLLKPNGEIEKIRRAETIDDYFATLDFSKI